MCTFTLAWQVFADAPVVVAANRDERLDRPAEPPAIRDWETRVLAPQDEEAHGTWLGYNEHGVLVAITNRWVDADLEGDRSRGLLVRDAFRYDSAEAAARFIERDLAERDYEGFNLVLVDADAAILVEYDGAPSVRNLDPGVHVVVNVGADGDYVIPESRQEFGEAQAHNADRVRETLQPEPGEDSEAWLDRAAEVIADHDYGVCIHGDGFGTRSSSLIRLGTTERTFTHAEGPPCETDYEPVPETL